MSLVLTSKEVAERALRKIGAFAINHTAADPAELEETLFWYDMTVGFLVETRKVFWLIPSAVSFPLAAGTGSYNLKTALGSSWPADGMGYIVGSYVRNVTSGKDSPVRILSRQQYDDLYNKSQQGSPGSFLGYPSDRLAHTHQLSIYVERQEEPTLWLHPIPSIAGFTLYLTLQTLSPDLTKNNGENAHGFLRGWNLWQVLATAAAIGGGPVRKLPRIEIADIRAEANFTLKELLAYSDREKESPRRTRAWGR